MARDVDNLTPGFGNWRACAVVPLISITPARGVIRSTMVWTEAESQTRDAGGDVVRS